MKKILSTVLFVVYTACIYADVASLVPVYIDLDDGSTVKTNAHFAIKRFPVNSDIVDIKNKFLADDLPSKRINDFFEVLQKKDRTLIENMSLGYDSFSTQRILKKFSSQNIDFKSVRLLDVFQFNDVFKVFYKVNDSKTGESLVSYFAFKKDIDGTYKRVVSINNALESLCSYSLLAFYKSQDYKTYGFGRCDNATKAPILKFSTIFDFSKMNFFKKQSDVSGFYDAFVQARSSGDVDLVTSFYTESSRRKVNDLLKMKVFEIGAKYKSRRESNDTRVVGIIPMDPLYVLIEQVCPRENEVYFKYIFIVKDANSNMQIANVFFESFFDDVLRSYKIMPQL